MTEKKFKLSIGQRSIKTAMAATLCALVYLLVGRNPTFACIGTVFGMGTDINDSIKHGGNRFFGTLIGGLLGMLIFRLYICFVPDGQFRALLLPFLFVGVLLLILVSRLFRWVGAVQPGSVVLCIILFNTPVDHYISYSINRIIDTGIGVAIALLINWLLPRWRVNHWKEILLKKLKKEK